MMSPCQVKRFDPAARAADVRDRASGKKSVVQLHCENGLLAFPRKGLAVDFAGFIQSPPEGGR